MIMIPILKLIKTLKLPKNSSNFRNCYQRKHDRSKRPDPSKHQACLECGEVKKPQGYGLCRWVGNLTDFSKQIFSVLVTPENTGKQSKKMLQIDVCV